MKEIKRTSEGITENKKPFFAFFLCLDLFKKYCLHCEQTENGLK